MAWNWPRGRDYTSFSCGAHARVMCCNRASSIIAVRVFSTYVVVAGGIIGVGNVGARVLHVSESQYEFADCEPSRLTVQLDLESSRVIAWLWQHSGKGSYELYEPKFGRASSNDIGTSKVDNVVGVRLDCGAEGHPAQHCHSRARVYRETHTAHDSRLRTRVVEDDGEPQSEVIRSRRSCIIGWLEALYTSLPSLQPPEREDGEEKCEHSDNDRRDGCGR